MNLKYSLVLLLVLNITQTKVFAIPSGDQKENCINAIKAESLKSDYVISKKAKKNINNFFSKLNAQHVEISPVNIRIAISEITNIPIIVVQTDIDLPFFFTANGFIKPMPSTRLFNRFKITSFINFMAGFHETFTMDDGGSLHFKWCSIHDHYVWAFDSTPLLYSSMGHEYQRLLEINAPLHYSLFKLQKSMFDLMEKFKI